MKLFSKKEKFILESEQQKEEFSKIGKQTAQQKP